MTDSLVGRKVRVTQPLSFYPSSIGTIRDRAFGSGHFLYWVEFPNGECHWIPRNDLEPIEEERHD